jgi:hypothetical protein
MFLLAPIPSAAQLSDSAWLIDPACIEVTMSPGQRVGRGGYADVYRGHLRIPGKNRLVVAVKTLLEEYAANPAHVRKFGKENAILFSCDHPNICKVSDIFFFPFIFMRASLFTYRFHCICLILSEEGGGDVCACACTCCFCISSCIRVE